MDGDLLFICSGMMYAGSGVCLMSLVCLSRLRCSWSCVCHIHWLYFAVTVLEVLLLVLVSYLLGCCSLVSFLEHT